MRNILAMLAVCALSLGAFAGDSLKVEECIKNLNAEQKAMVQKAKGEMNQVTNQDGTINEAKMEQLRVAKEAKVQECVQQVPEKLQAKVEEAIKKIQQDKTQKQLQFKE